MAWNLAIAVVSMAVFLGGLNIMRIGLAGLSQGRLPALLQRLANTPTRGIATGTVVTALVQSSAAVTAIAVGMVAGGSMAFRDALGIVLGSNVGSTVTPQLLALNLWVLVIPALAVGGILLFIPQTKLRYTGMALSGFAMIFIALQALSTALKPLSQTVWFQQLLAGAAHNAVLAAVTGMLASAIIQSSTATTVIAMALTGQSLIPVHGAIALVLGANVGTCLTSVVAAIGQSRAAQQVALSHVVLNVGGVLLFLPFLGPYTHWMSLLSPSPAQQIANAHTLFNLICTVLVWPITPYFADFIERLLPDHRYA